MRFGFSVDMPAARRASCQRRLSASPPSMQASDDPIVDVPIDLLGVGRVPQRRDHLPAAGLDRGGLRVLVLVDHVLVGRLGVQLVGERIHPRADEGREVQPRVAVEHRLVVDDLVGRLGQRLPRRQDVEREVGRLARAGEHRVELILIADAGERVGGLARRDVSVVVVMRLMLWRRAQPCHHALRSDVRTARDSYARRHDAEPQHPTPPRGVGIRDRIAVLHARRGALLRRRASVRWPTHATFFVGALFFTAGRLHPARAERPATAAARTPIARIVFDWWAAAVQFVGTLFFNVSTTEGLIAAIRIAGSSSGWRPDALGSICFLVASAFAVVATTERDSLWDPRARTWRCTVAEHGRLGVLRHLRDRRLRDPRRRGPRQRALGERRARSSAALCFLVAALLSRPATLRGGRSAERGDGLGARPERPRARACGSRGSRPRRSP